MLLSLCICLFLAGGGFADEVNPDLWANASAPPRLALTLPPLLAPPRLLTTQFPHPIWPLREPSIPRPYPFWTYEQDGFTLTLLLFHQERKSWNEARQACARAGRRLAQPSFKRKNRFIKKVLQHLSPDAGVWFGASGLKQLTFAEWNYTDGRGVKFTDWGKGEPRERNIGKYCAHYAKHLNFQWSAAERCNYKQYYICEESSKKSTTGNREIASKYGGKSRPTMIVGR